jgi:hypothetical protein
MAQAFDPVRSVVLHGQRFRAVFNSIYLRPSSETFHEFLVHFLQTTFGRDWWLSQARVSDPHRHIVISWFDAWVAKTKEPGTPVNTDASVRQCDADGPVWSILSLAWDVFSLASKGNLPSTLVDRLRSKELFQGARFELCAAALLFRHDFDVQFLADNAKDGRHCEFIAIDCLAGVRLGVEAKSRKRPGAVHEPGEFELKRDARGLEAFIRKASKQKPDGLPFVILVDINLPASPQVGPLEKPWLKDAQSALGLIGEPTSTRRDAFNAVLLTNYCYHWGDKGEPMPRAEFGVVISGAPESPMDQRTLNRVIAAVQAYGTIPAEV